MILWILTECSNSQHLTSHKRISLWLYLCLLFKQLQLCLYSFQGPSFEPAHGSIDPQPYYRACLEDSCACVEQTGCLCSILSAYAFRALRLGIILTWRNKTLCGKYLLGFMVPLFEMDHLKVIFFWEVMQVVGNYIFSIAYTIVKAVEYLRYFARTESQIWSNYVRKY